MFTPFCSLNELPIQVGSAYWMCVDCVGSQFELLLLRDFERERERGEEVL